MSLINTQVQPFKANAFHNGKFIEVTEQSLQGKWSVLIFMPAAFTFNCPTEIEDAANNYAEFQKAGAEVYIVTTDTHFSHLSPQHKQWPLYGMLQIMCDRGALVLIVTSAVITPIYRFVMIMS